MSARIIINIFKMSAVLLTTACHPFTSGVKIDNGTHIEVGGNTVNSVFGIQTNGAACTAQAVSLNTAITAAHCVANSAQPNVCITTASNSGECSTNVYVPRQYNGNTSAGVVYDLAIVVFDSPIFPGFFGVRHTEDYIEIGEPFYLVGYSRQNATITASGSKNWGQNTITSLAEGNITLASDGTGGNTVSPGDSGGGAFTSCQLVGVASRLLNTDVPGPSKGNLHTNLLWKDNFDYLTGITSLNPDAYICGLHGWDEAHCPLDKVFFEDLSPDADQFVCTSIAQERG